MHNKYKGYKGFINIVVAIIVVYFLLCTFSIEFANFLAGAATVVAIICAIFKTLFIDSIYQNSINSVQKKYVTGHNMLGNKHCSVKYSPNDKIVVMDNHPNRNQQKRMFSVKTGKRKVNQLWNKLCKTFDEYVTLDSLAVVLGLETNIDIITIDSPQPNPKPSSTRRVNIDNSNIGPKFVELGEIQRDIYMDGTNVPNAGGEDFVEINKLQSTGEVKERMQAEPDFIDMSAVVSKLTSDADSKRIDINNATDEEIASLPGVNIILAKKAIEFRNKNGAFRTLEQFMNIVNVKPHFASKIKSMIYLGEVPNLQQTDEDNDGRIVDF